MAGPAAKRVAEATRTVIVARSHPTSAEPVRAFLDGIGFVAQRYSDQNSLSVVTEDDVAGALISTGVTMEVEQSPIEVLARLRALRPNLPVAFVTLVSFDRLRRGWAARLGPDIEMIEGSRLALRRPDLGYHDVIPVLHVSDVEQADGQDITSAIIARHFR